MPVHAREETIWAIAGSGGDSHALIRILLRRVDTRLVVWTEPGVDAADGHADSIKLRIGHGVERA
jgi:hypothetical protein